MIVTLDRRSGRPLYRQLADELRARIESGALAPGDELPSQVSLAAEYDLGRDTVQDALTILRTEGWIVTERGKPAYVAEVVETVTLGHGDEMEVHGGTVTVTRADGAVETYPAGRVRVVPAEPGHRT